jgi:hypothetical protein
MFWAWGRKMWWYALQGGIITAVAVSNIYWHWTPNPYLVGTAGWLAALIVTGFVVGRLERRAARKAGLAEAPAAVGSRPIFFGSWPPTSAPRASELEYSRRLPQPYSE